MSRKKLFQNLLLLLTLLVPLMANGTSLAESGAHGPGRGSGSPGNVQAGR